MAKNIKDFSDYYPYRCQSNIQFRTLLRQQKKAGYQRKYYGPNSIIKVKYLVGPARHRQIYCSIIEPLDLDTCWSCSCPFIESSCTLKPGRAGSPTFKTVSSQSKTQNISHTTFSYDAVQAFMVSALHEIFHVTKNS